MSKTPTFVVGVGGRGVTVLKKLHDRASDCGGDAEHVELLAVDSDSRTLKEADHLDSIYLESPDGVVDETIEQYPFLTSDVTIPDEGAGNLRHVGRYKLDNPLAPTHQAIERELRGRIETFLEGYRASFTHTSSGICNVVLVSSLGGGTGSGTLPLFAGMLSSIRDQIESDETTVRIVGIGLLPPLDLEFARSLPPVEHVSYLNTYAALRNIADFPEADDSPIEIPVYASNRNEESNSYGTPGKTITLKQQPFDLLWLVEDTPIAVDVQPDPGSADGRAKAIADTINAFSVGASGSSDDWSLSSPVSPLGTVGYAAITVPHGALEDYCERKAEREEVRKKLEAFVGPKLRSLRERRQNFETALQTEDPKDSSILIARLERATGEDRDDRTELLIESGVDELRAVLDDIEVETDALSYFRTLLGLRSSVHEGDIATTVQEDIETTVTEVRGNYEFEVISRHEAQLASPAERLEKLRSSLEKHEQRLCQSLAETDPDVRDLVPPDLVTSDREDIEMTLDCIKDDLKRLSTVRSRHDTIEEIRAACDERLKSARETIQQCIEQYEREISHFENQREQLQDELATLDRNVTSLRESLADPEERDNELVLPLEWSAVGDVTEETLDEVDSIAAYSAHGLLAADTDAMQTLLTTCFDRSRDWPEALTRQTSPVASTEKHQETFVLYHEANDAIIDESALSSIGSNRIRYSGRQGIPFADDPYRIEMLSMFQQGEIESLLGFRRLESTRDKGFLDTVTTQYQSKKRALAYPEWYESNTKEAFR